MERLFKFSFEALLMHTGSNGKRSKAGSMCCPAQKAAYGGSDISDLERDCGGTVSSTEPPVYLGSPPYYSRILECFQQKNGVTRCLAQPPQGSATQQRKLTQQAQPHANSTSQQRQLTKAPCTTRAHPHLLSRQISYAPCTRVHFAPKQLLCHKSLYYSTSSSSSNSNMNN